MRRLALPFLLMGALAQALSGCASGRNLSTRADGLETRLVKIEMPAMRCAEHDYAVAKANLAFARVELDEGSYFRAHDHLDLALDAARSAEAAARAPECLTTPDRDGDGIPDAVDKCPDAAEDKDGDRDTDGCPEDGDRDHDGIVDSRDRCPDEPGDKEHEGCPNRIQDRDGDGIADDVDKCPDTPEDKDGFEDEDGCPDPDNDKDGVLDAVDKCPLQPEDIDNFEDADGCPDPDNDQDRIADAQDQCPNQPEDYDGDQDQDGCPDIYKNIIVRDDRIELKQTVYFATGRDTILSKSYPLLNEVALALRDNPTFTVSIEGHTDSQGAANVNQTLSQKRAEAVRRYLIDQGIAPTRLQAVGYGEDRPIEDNRTAEGRAANRRVEFHILQK